MVVDLSVQIVVRPEHIKRQRNHFIRRKQVGANVIQGQVSSIICLLPSVFCYLTPETRHLKTQKDIRGTVAIIYLINLSLEAHTNQFIG